MTPASILGSAGQLLSAPAGWFVGLVAHAGLSEISSWVRAGAAAALRETAQIIGQATAPRLTSAWFSSTYWRVAGLAAVMTLPFLFAATIQALLRGDLTLLVRAAFGYLPLALLAVSLAAPLAMLLLAATDEMCAVVSAAGAGGGAQFLDQAALVVAAGVPAGAGGFLGVAMAIIVVGASLALCLELLVRAAAVYVVVLMLPLAFAALVWPARRVWATRLLELLVALILCKFVIVAVLSLAGAAYDQSGGHSVSRVLVAMALVLLSTFAPWAMLRILPFTELAAGAAGGLRAEVPRAAEHYRQAQRHVGAAAEALPAWMARRGLGRRDEEPLEELPALPAQLAPRAGAAGAVGAADTAGAAGAAGAAGQRSSTAGPEPSTTAVGPSASPPPAPGAPLPPPAAPASGSESERTPESERIPGAEERWQLEDGAWPPMRLGPDGWFATDDTE